MDTSLKAQTQKPAKSQPPCAPIQDPWKKLLLIQCHMVSYLNEIKALANVIWGWYSQNTPQIYNIPSKWQLYQEEPSTLRVFSRILKKWKNRSGHENFFSWLKYHSLNFAIMSIHHKSNELFILSTKNVLITFYCSLVSTDTNKQWTSGHCPF